MYTVQEIKELRRLTVLYDMRNCEILDKYTDAQLLKIYNGIGPDAFPDWLREAISDLNWDLKAVALIHDVQWYEHQVRLFQESNVPEDESRAVFLESNAAFGANGRAAAAAKYGWYNPLRYRTMGKATWFAYLCGTDQGFEAFNRAIAPRV